MAAVKARNIAQAGNVLSKSLRPIDKLDEIILYRGTTGSEGVGQTLFLTSDATVAAGYASNGGTVIQGVFSRVGLKKLEFAGQLTQFTGTHGPTGRIAAEYKFIGKELKQAVLSLMK